MAVLTKFPPAPEVLASLLEQIATAQTQVGADLKSVMPMYRTYRFGGGDNGITDLPLLGVDAFAGTYAEAEDLAEEGRQLIIAAPHNVVTDDGVVVIDRAYTIEGPHEVPYGDSGVRRIVASYALQLRRAT